MRVSHDPYVVAASFAIALLASYVTLDLARQVRSPGHQGRLAWWAAGSVVMEDLRATQHTSEGLARIGVFLSIDDFGAGYSSLNYLRQLPARQLKIDRSFVSDLEHSAQARAVVGAVVKLAHALGMRVVGEGVETRAQHEMLRAVDCDEFQGFYFARPMSAAALMVWLQADQPLDAGDGNAQTPQHPSQGR